MSVVRTPKYCDTDFTVTARQFGVGDGTRTVWNLAGMDSNRALLMPSLYQRNWQGGARSNLWIKSEPQLADLDSTGGNPAVANATLAVPGLGTLNALNFPATPTVQQYAYKTSTVTAGHIYSISAIVQMADLSQPVLGFDIYSGDLMFVVGSNQIISGSISYTNLGNNCWRIGWNGYVAVGSAGFNGVMKTTTQSTKAFTVTAIQLEENSTITPYIKTTGSSVTVYDGAYTPLYSTSRTNLCLQSQTLNSWGMGNTTVTADATVAPDGTTTAERIVETATNAVHDIADVITNGAVASTFSVYAKAGERTFIWISADNGATASFFNLGAGTLGTVAQTAGILSVGNGWYRCWISQTPGANTTLMMGPASADNTISYLGDISKGIYAWGAQFETGSTATPYIPTTTTSVSVTDYSVDGTGKVTYATAPPAGTLLSYLDPYAGNVQRGIGAGDGTSTQFSLPFAPAVPVVKDNGVTKTIVTDYNYTPDGKITFVMAPVAGHNLTMDGTMGPQR